MEDGRRAIEEALQLLGVKNFVLGIQDPSFPGLPDEDLGRGSPYSRGAARFLEFAASLGFNGLQLGPQGMTHAGSPSPYEATAFSRNPLNLPVHALEEAGLLAAATRERLVAAREPESLARVPYQEVRRLQAQALAEVHATYRSHAGPLGARVARFARENRSWLLSDALYEPLCREHGAAYFERWGAEGQALFDRNLWHPAPGDEAAAAGRIAQLEAQHAEELERYALFQLLLEDQHHALRERCATRGLKLYGDLQVGLSAQDTWAAKGLFLTGYRLGAPPSRTNPQGQPWGYSVLDPARFGTREAPGPVLALLTRRLDKLFAEFDGVRLDHPHGLICPWVYRSGQEDSLAAVQHGARLFDSPDLPDHPALAPLAIARADQLDRTLPRHADGAVRTLEPLQVARYSILLDAIVASSERHGRRREDLVCEVLSTQPYPLRRVMERHGLGRFRVTQKANLAHPEDVYRSENARPEDWIMLGNHDTPPIWQLVEGWREGRAMEEQAAYLAERLMPPGEDRAHFARRLGAHPGELMQAKFADVLASPAQNVFVFFTDLLGSTEVFNSPGTVSDSNWSLRVTPDYREAYGRRVERAEALNIPRALAMALRARGLGTEALLTRLAAA